MSKMIQIRNVPDEVHRRLKSRAALAGLSMSDYVLRELEQVLSRPTRAEVFARIAELPPDRVGSTDRRNAAGRTEAALSQA